jgi:hypothetical protein
MFNPEIKRGFPMKIEKILHDEVIIIPILQVR